MPVSKKRNKKKPTTVVQKHRKAAEARRVRRNITEIQDLIEGFEKMQAKEAKRMVEDAEVR